MSARSVRRIDAPWPSLNPHHRMGRRGDRHAARNMERLPAPVAGVVPGLSRAGLDAHEADPPAPGLGTRSRSETRPGTRRRGRGRSARREDRADHPAPPIEDRQPIISDHQPTAAAPDYSEPATRIALKPVDRDTGEEIERDEVVKGYEYQRGQFVTFTPKELKTLEVESTHTIDLTTFVPRADVDPVYFNTPYYVYPDGPLSAEAFGVIGTAMARSGMAGLGRVTVARRERMVFVEPRGAGMVLITLRAAEEVRAAQFGAIGDIDPEMVAVAETIIQRRAGSFDPVTFRDRYQDALRELVEAKLKGLPVKAKPTTASTPVIDLMGALKRSLQQETGSVAPTKSRARKSGDRRQANLLLPVAGRGPSPSPGVAASRARLRKKA